MEASGPGVHILISLLMMGGMVAGWIILLVAVWRGMKAHESVAESLRRMADKRE